LKWPITATTFASTNFCAITGPSFGYQLEADRLAADLRATGVEFVDGHLRAILVVLAVARLPAGERRGEADPHDVLRRGRCGVEHRRDAENRRTGG
jgi:hypothetical protein